MKVKNVIFSAVMSAILTMSVGTAMAEEGVQAISVASTAYVDTKVGSVDNSIQEALSGFANDAATTGQFVTAVSRENGVITVSRAALDASDIPKLSIEKVNGLQDSLNAKFEVPAYTTTTQNGKYVLTATELDGKVTYAWENIAGRTE